jgi:hypothetical protein
MQFKLWFGIFIRLQGWWALLLGAICLAATLFSVYDYQLAARFDREAIIVPVTVQRLWTTTSYSRHGGRTTHYHGEFVYTVGGRHVDREESISRAEYQLFGTGGTFPMRVLPDDPTELETTKGETLGTAHFVQWLALGFGLAALGLGYWIGQEAALMVLARRLGQVRLVPVSAHDEAKRKGKPTGHGRLVWIGPRGEPAKSLTHPMTDLRDYPVGAQIEVFQRKDRSFWAVDVGGRQQDRTDIPAVPPRAEWQ